MYLIDSHCHFHLLLPLEKSSLDDVINRAKKSGVEYFLNVSVNIADFPEVLKIAESYPEIVTSVGLHPNDQNESVDIDTILSLARHSKVVAIGETGLDYYRSTGELSWQQERFRIHIQAAKKLNKPLIIHSRNAALDTINIMQEEKASETGGVMHCFSEDWNVAKKALDMNFYISFSGIVTFKNAKQVQEVAKAVPMNRILIETDSPYLAPNPHRGKLNEPGFLRHTAEFLAQLKDMPFEDFALQTTQNFFHLFKGAVNPHV